jgi:hypothetical protein
MKNVKQANINVTLKGLFKHWMEITRAFHKLTPQQQKILALFLYHHYNLKQQITNEKILWKMVFDYDTKMKIKEEVETTDQVLRNTLVKFKKKGIIQKGKIVPTYIPELSKDARNFKVIFNFNVV